MTRIAKEAKKRRGLKWLLVLPVLVVSLVALAAVVSASAAGNHPLIGTFSTTQDQLGANDVPGQKDLTMQGTNNSSESAGDLWVVWNWDDTSISGNNTLDACTLFDTDATANGFADLAVCLTVQKSGSSLSIKTTTVYSCGDTRADRCTSSAAIDPKGTYCELETGQTGPFDSSDTQAFCDIKVGASALNLSSATNLLNTCSYPSAQPNSDPSDCVLVPGAVSSQTTTSPFSSPTWTVTLNDSAAATNATSGTVTFKLYGPSDPTCGGTPLWTATANVSSTGAASTFPTGGAQVSGSPSGANVVNTAGTYHWIAAYSGQSGVNSSASACGEAQTVAAPTVT